jgi:hypothetical protein
MDGDPVLTDTWKLAGNINILALKKHFSILFEQNIAKERSAISSQLSARASAFFSQLRGGPACPPSVPHRDGYVKMKKKLATEGTENTE